MAMQARQDWGTGMLELQPHKGAKKGKAIHIDLRGGKHESLDLETSMDEFTSSDYSTSQEESTITDESDISQAEIMGVVLTNPTMISSINVPQVEEGFLYPVEDSEWVSLVVVTPKKIGKWRVCVDYKPLNAATKRDHSPLPFQDEILNEVAGYERYTMCDGYSGYFQIRIAEEDQKKTIFVTPWGCFSYRVMPFGLTNAPATFQRFVTHVFQPFFGKSIRVFIDDFYIYNSCVLHFEKVNEGLARLQSLGGQLNVDKCHIAESQFTLLGHVVSSRGIEADPGKVQALVSLPSPKSLKKLVSFIQKTHALPKQKIHIQLKSYWIDCIEEATKLIANVARNTETKIMGAMSLPTKRHVYCVLRSPHVNKDSREHFDICTHQRLIELENLNAQTINALMQLENPSGVDVEVNYCKVSQLVSKNNYYNVKFTFSIEICLVCKDDLICLPPQKVAAGCKGHRVFCPRSQRLKTSTKCGSSTCFRMDNTAVKASQGVSSNVSSNEANIQPTQVLIDNTKQPIFYADLHDVICEDRAENELARGKAWLPQPLVTYSNSLRSLKRSRPSWASYIFAALCDCAHDKVDARLIKATVLDGDDIISALDFLIKEGMPTDNLKLEKPYSSASNSVHVDGIFVAKKHPVRLKQDEFYSTDSSHDKHEESIVWKGGLVSHKLEDHYPNEGRGLDDFYESDYQQERAIMQGNERIDWWAATWPYPCGPKEAVFDSLSSVQTNSEVEEEGSSSLWSDTELFNSIRKKVICQEPIVKTDLSSSGSLHSSLLEKDKESSSGNVSGFTKLHAGCKSLLELDLPLSQVSLEGFSPMAVDANMSEQGGSASNLSRRHTQSPKYHVKDNDSELFLSLSCNVRGDCQRQEGLLQSSRYIINTNDLDEMVVEAKCCKENVRKSMEDIYLLRQKTEQEELVAQQAKAEATRGGVDILLKVEDLRQQIMRERADYDARAAEVYGERSVLSMEARELRSRLLETKAEQERAMSLLDCVRYTLTKRLQKASREKHSAIEEAKMKEENAKELLAREEGSAQILVENFKALETEAGTCGKLRERLIEHGNIVDSLQGEMAVLSEDILNFKKQVDEGIPLSSSRSLSWSHISNLTEQFVSTTPLEVNCCRPSKASALESSSAFESSDLINLSSDTSILTLSSATSGLPASVGPIDCALQSQYFSQIASPITVVNEKGVAGGFDEELGGALKVCIAYDDDQKEQMNVN
ncbi:hypothetical protein L7F22_010039 [Adiantum nelumboides]|nr:hypothetical protein [Adiantum nelumboides]